MIFHDIEVFVDCNARAGGSHNAGLKNGYATSNNRNGGTMDSAGCRRVKFGSSFTASACLNSISSDRWRNRGPSAICFLGVTAVAGRRDWFGGSNSIVPNCFLTCTQVAQILVAGECSPAAFSKNGKVVRMDRYSGSYGWCSSHTAYGYSFRIRCCNPVT